MRAAWATTKQPPRVHFALAGEWLLQVRPYTTNRFGAWLQRIGWAPGETRVFRTLEDAKAWLEREAERMG